VIQGLLNTNFIKGSKSLGIDLFINADGSFDINCVILNQHRNKVSIEKKYSGLTSLKNLNDKEYKGLPVSLSVDGRGILFKKIEKKQGFNTLQQLLPNAKETEFYSQSISSTENFVFVSAVRRDVIDPVLDELKLNDHFIVNLNIGPFAIANILGLVENISDLFTNKYQIISFEGFIDSISRVTESKLISYKLGDEEVYSEELIAYASALDFYIHYSNINAIEKINEYKSEYIFKKLFTIAGWSILIFFLVLLMINSMYYSKYNEKLNSLSYAYNQNQELFRKLDTLRSELKLKEEYFVKSGFLDESKLAFYTDRIAESLPGEIHLTAFNFNPLKVKMKDNKPIDFLTGTINISGTVTQSIILNNWVKGLKKTDWINSIAIIGYNQESAGIPAEFTIEIDIK